MIPKLSRRTGAEALFRAGVALVQVGVQLGGEHLNSQGWPARAQGADDALLG
jgi:hypothetical protein